MNLRLAAESKFEGCKREELVVYCTVLGIEVKEGHNVPNLIKKLLDTLGQYNELSIADPEEAHAKAVKLTELNLSDLNLASTGRWQGKRRIVTLHRAAAYDTAFPLFLAWENMHVYLPYGTKAALPWPIWCILHETSKAKKMIRKRHLDDEGRISYRETWVPDQPYMYTDHGDDPDTALLPATIMQAVRDMYDASEGLKSYNERQIREICRRLRIGAKREWSRETMLADIQMVLSIPISMGEASGGLSASQSAARKVHAQ